MDLKGPEQFVHLTYDEFIKKVSEEQGFVPDSLTVKGLWIQNPNKSIFHPRLTTKQEMPTGGLMFLHFKQVERYKNLEELILSDLFVSDIPDNVLNLQNLKIFRFCFTYSANLAHSAEILGKMKSLKEVDIHGSRLNLERIEFFRDEMRKRGIKVAEIPFFQEE